MWMLWLTGHRNACLHRLALKSQVRSAKRGRMDAIATKFSSIEKERLSLEQAVERFRSRAVSEFWRLQDRLPRYDPSDRKVTNHAPLASAKAWEQARQRHHLARQGLIPWQADPIAPTRPVTVLRNEDGGPGPSDRLATPRAA